MRQLSLLNQKPSPYTFGGSLLKSGTNSKSARPLDSKRPIHLVLRAERSVMRLPRYFSKVNGLVVEVAGRYGVRIYEYANCGNHLHHVIKLPNRATWGAFIRELTGRLAQLTGVRWLNRPFTRIVEGWRRAFKIVKAYVKQNAVELDLRLSRHDAKDLFRRLRPLRNSERTGPSDRFDRG